MTTKNCAWISIDQKLLGQILDFAGCNIMSCRLSDYFGSLDVLLEHPDLPEVKESNCIPRVIPAYTKYFGENRVITKIERIREKY